MIRATTADAYQLMHEGSIALAQVESNGVRIDTKYLDNKLVEIKKEIKVRTLELQEDEVWTKWKRHFGNDSNLDAPKQLAKIMFGVLGYKSIRKTDTTGEDAADEEAFKHIDLPFMKEYIALKKLKKLDSTYLRGIYREVCDGLLHASYNLHIAITYRSSCDTPNFQNIPVRNPEIAAMIRRCFIARKGRRCIGEIDFKGIEVGVGTCYHKDKNMIRYVTDPTTDMHRDSAMEIYLLTAKQVSKTTRYCAKNMFVFPEFYGSYYVQCAEHLWEAIPHLKLVVEGTETSLKEHLRSKGIKKLGKCDPDQSPEPGTFEYHIQQVEKILWEKRFPQYAKWKKSFYSDYLRTGEFDFYTGFKVRGGPYKRNQVVNSPIQGSAFHCLLWCLIRLQNWLTRNNMGTLIVGQIHDSMILDFVEDEIPRVLRKFNKIVTEELPRAFPWINVPMSTEVEIAPVGGSWHDKKRVA